MNYYDLNKLEAELALRGYEKTKAPAVSPLAVNVPSTNKAINRSNFCISVLKNNRILFFSLLISLLFFVLYALTPAGSLVFVLHILLLSAVHYLTRDAKIYPYIMCILSSFALMLAKLV